VSQLWADVKYHVPTGFVFRRRRVVFILGAMPPPTLGRLKAVFYVFVSVPKYFSTEPFSY
ncbi:MAG: hypothetical protein SOV34_05085, partial [Sodaliphilus sp.]|nr:hypothetical protein [Sodaliphilus sp.]